MSIWATSFLGQVCDLPKTNLESDWHTLCWTIALKRNEAWSWNTFVAPYWCRPSRWWYAFVLAEVIIVDYNQSNVSVWLNDYDDKNDCLNFWRFLYQRQSQYAKLDDWERVRFVYTRMYFCVRVCNTDCMELWCACADACTLVHKLSSNQTRRVNNAASCCWALVFKPRQADSGSEQKPPWRSSVLFIATLLHM